MKITKKAISLVFAAALALSCACFSVFASSGSGEAGAPVFADSLRSGRYDINVTSSSSMFRIVRCELTVSGSDMTAEMTLSGKGYEKLFMGTSQAAESADESEYCFFHETTDGKYAYTVPVKALDMDTDCAAYSFKKQRWYDRTLVFASDSLPEAAFVAGEERADETGGIAPVWEILAPVALAVLAVVVLLVVKGRRK